ncbi:hypothetical protein M8C21_001846 [Ambrosia artemisiifolia]|uniref:Uncharacterized protein n=1 Tax=Ambrosia artemisiifolia TaxID=4212 RepID=A0AAD5GMX9_AMBAR|nr:hypothetical protein M8C21_001846 [Ambrosia artemisiifolia]
MGDPSSNRATLRDKFELEKFRSKGAKNAPEMESSSPSNFDQKQKTMEMEELIKHMKHLPSYLERGKPVQDRALSFGVMDWARLEKWHSRHHKHGFVKSNRYSPSSTCSSSLFSADESSPRSSRDQSCSPARQNFRRVTLQSHFKASPKDDFTPHVQSCSKYAKKLHYSEDFSKQSSMKGKLKIQDEFAKDKSNPISCTFRAAAINGKSSQRELDFSRNQSSPARNKTPEIKISTMPCKSSESKPRSISPLRRLSFSLKSATERSDSPASQGSNKDSKRAHSSPLRRLLEPIFPSKETCHEDSRTKARVKLDFTKEIKVDDVLSSSSSRKQALFQTTVKNDRLLFTFAVDNNMEILAATVTSLTSSEKDKNKNLLYTFFTVHEVKKKSISWLSQVNKSKDHSYVPNVTAQMKVSNSHYNTREFVLFSVNANVQPQEELEAIVVKFPRNTNGDSHRESFETTVILPGGSHGVPSKGGPSPLVDRWRSGGACDCGGWDVGCRLRTLSKQVQSSGSKSDNVHSTSRQFDLFLQGEVENKRPIFSLSLLKEGIFSIEYNSSLSPLQAFAICISYVESQKLTPHTELRTHAREAVPLVYTPIPRIKRNATFKATL